MAPAKDKDKARKPDEEERRTGWFGFVSPAKLLIVLAAQTQSGRDKQVFVTRSALLACPTRRDARKSRKPIWARKTRCTTMKRCIGARISRAETPGGCPQNVISQASDLACLVAVCLQLKRWVERGKEDEYRAEAGPSAPPVVPAPQAQTSAPADGAAPPVANQQPPVAPQAAGSR